MLYYVKCYLHNYLYKMLLIIVIILSIMLLFILLLYCYNYIKFKGGNGSYKYINRNNTFDYLNNSVDESKFGFSDNKYDVCFKLAFKNCIYKLFMKNVAVYVEFDKGSKELDYELILNKIDTYKYKTIISLEVNENYVNYHWYKSLISDLQNINTIKTKDIQNIKAGSFQICCNNESTSLSGFYKIYPNIKNEDIDKCVKFLTKPLKFMFDNLEYSKYVICCLNDRNVNDLKFKFNNYVYCKINLDFPLSKIFIELIDFYKNHFYNKCEIKNTYESIFYKLMNNTNIKLNDNDIINYSKFKNIKPKYEIILKNNILIYDYSNDDIDFYLNHNINMNEFKSGMSPDSIMTGVNI